MKKQNNSKLIIISSIVLAAILVISMAIVIVNCVNDRTKLVIRPTEEYVIGCLHKVPGILEIKAVTEETDPMKNLNKPGWYTAHVYFSYVLVNQDDVYGDDLLEKGTDAGGSVEVYKTKEEAKERDEYLAQFDGSILDSGSHVAIGTIVVRTSDLLTVSQQKELEENIISALLGELSEIKNPATETGPSSSQNSDELDYERLIDFPPRAIDNTCMETCDYLVYYPSQGDYAIYATVDITKFVYDFNDSSNNEIEIIFAFECYLYDIYDYADYFAFNIVAYDNNGSIIGTQTVFGEGEIDDTMRLYATLTLNKSDVQDGAVIEFTDYKE